jgi:hypothetical protein
VSPDCRHALKHRLTTITRGMDTLVEYLQHFKAVYDDLVAIGKSIPNPKKSWWFLNGLGKGYEMFNTTMLRPLVPPYSEVVTLVESHTACHKLDIQTPQMVFCGQCFNMNKKGNGSSHSFNS